jgi:hypothetical protein
VNKRALNPINILGKFIVVCLSIGFSSIGRSTGSTSVAYRQCCCATLDYLVRDEKGKLLSADRVKAEVLEKVWGNGGDSGDLRFHLPSYLLSSVHNAGNTGYSMEELERAPKSLQFETGCVTRLIKVALEYRDQRMILSFRNTPFETTFYVDSLPFQAGEFEIECSRRGSGEILGKLSSKDLDNEKDLKKLKGAAVVSAKQWKKVK